MSLPPENTPPAATGTIPLWERHVQVAHAWQRDVERGDGPVYVVAVLPWLATLDGLSLPPCERCASRTAVSDAPGVTGYVIAHGSRCGYLADLIAQGIADGVLDQNGEAAA